MTKQKSLIGTQLDCCFKTIEAGHINRLNHTFVQPNSYVRHNSQYPATREPFTHYPTFLLGNLINLPAIYKILDVNINHVLLSRESVIHHVQLNVGDVITIKTFLKDVYEQQASSNPIGFIILETIGHMASDIAFYSERVLAVRGGFQRGKAR